MPPYKRKKYHHGDNTLSKKYKTKRKTKDLDEIDEDIKPQSAEKLLNQEVDYDLPGCAQFYCLHCARYFIDNYTLGEHFRTKVHKRRLKALEVEPFTQKDADIAAGHGNYVPPKRRKIETQSLKESEMEK
uniref:Zinc finger protein 593 homolog n=1 Tax=Strigamia maritima TaxID=126957 RepID=T1JB80_STRMM